MIEYLRPETNAAIRAEEREAEESAKKLDGTSDEFGTPDYIFKPLHEEFHFTLDAAASYKNTKISRYITKEQDALTQDWQTFGCAPGEKNTAVWCNPPYSRGNAPAFVKKAWEESYKQLTTVLLIPARTEQDWFHDIVLKFGEVRFIRRRIKFVGGATSARQTHMVVIFPNGGARWARRAGLLLPPDTNPETRCVP